MNVEYRGLKAELVRHIVTGEEIESQIQMMLKTNPRTTVVTDRLTKLGDEVLLNYAGFCDGVQFPGGTAENQTLLLGSGTFIPGFEEQLVGKNTGEDVVVKVTFPEEYHAEDLAGKDAEFRCKILEIRVKSPSVLDDTFAREVAGCESVAELRQKLQESMQAQADQKSEMELQDRLTRMAADAMGIVPDEAQIAEAVEEQIRILGAQLGQQGLSLELYCQFMGTTEEKLREEIRPNALESLRIQMVVDQVVSQENLEVTDQEFEDALIVVARQNRMTLEQLMPHFDEEFRIALNRSVLSSKAMKLIRDNADVTTVSENM